MHRFLRVTARVAAVAAIVAGVGAGVVVWWLGQPLTLPSSPYVFDIRAGASLRSIARELAGAGLMRSPLPLEALARWRNADRAIKAGNYEVTAGVTLPQLLDKLVQGDVTQTSLTVVEGSTFAALKAALGANPDVARTVLGLPDDELMRRVGAPGGHPEGWFFPDTYFYSKGSTDAGLLARAYRLMQARLDAAWRDRAPDLPFTEPYQALILASIVEKETGSAADRPLIASVLVNRLRLGMRLQADPTVIYGMGESFDGNLRKRDLEADTPWNTYVRAGLPPTPIAFPGQAALDAVTRPPQTPYLYFVARGDGRSEFSATLADHNRAVAKYQKGHASP